MIALWEYKYGKNNVVHAMVDNETGLIVKTKFLKPAEAQWVDQTHLQLSANTTYPKRLGWSGTLLGIFEDE